MATEASADRFELRIVRWEGRIRCVYLNDHRIAGGKPWGGGEVVAKFTVSRDDLLSAIPGLSSPATPSQDGKEE